MAEEQPAAQLILYTGPRDSAITVLASGARSRLSDTGQAVTIISREEIERMGGDDLARILHRAPSVTISRNGGPGSFTALRVRGAEADQLLVLVDGVRVADSAAPGNGFDLGNMLAGEVQKIELLRSANSVIWGSQAIAGVMQVQTQDRSAFALPALAASAELGSRDTASLSVRANGDAGPVRLHISGGHFATDGISAAADGTERDGFSQWRIGGGAAADLAAGLTAFANGRYVRGRLEFDGFPAPDFVLADTEDFQITRQHSGAAGLRLDRADLQLTAALSAATTRRDSFDPAFGTDPAFRTNGRSRRAELRGRWTPDGSAGGALPGWQISFGAEREWSRFSSSFDNRQQSATSGAYVQLGHAAFGPDGRLSANAGLRVEDHARFGTISVAGADAAYDLGGGWRLRGAFGQGFKAPSLFQLFSDFGNAELRPERSSGFDLGLALGDRNSSPHLALTMFRRDSRDLIDFVSCFGVAGGICTGRPFGTYDNVARARAQGIEAEARVPVTETLKLGAAYAFIDTQNRADGLRLARRPRHAATLAADWGSGPLALGTDLRLVSASFDNRANTVRLPGHAVLDLRASMAVSDTAELFGRIENVWNETYQTAAGYGTPGRAAYAGARLKW